MNQDQKKIHTPESLRPELSAVNTFVLGNFKSINRISEIFSVSVLFFTAVALTAKVVIFVLVKKFQYVSLPDNKSDKISTCICSTQHIEVAAVFYSKQF